jgi:hypothetical protein
MSDSQTEHAALMRTRDREGAMAKVDRKESAKNYKGFVAGVFSGIAKLTGMFTYFRFYLYFQYQYFKLP